MNDTVRKTIVGSVVAVVGIVAVAIAISFPTIPVGIALGWAGTKYWNEAKAFAVNTFNKFWN